jgi:hypothetical protein
VEFVGHDLGRNLTIGVEEGFVEVEVCRCGGSAGGRKRRLKRANNGDREEGEFEENIYGNEGG